MKINYRFTCVKIFLAVTLSCPAGQSFAKEKTAAVKKDTAAGEFNMKEASFLLPQALPKGKYSSALYLLNVVLPPDWTHDIIKAPMFCYAAKYTLPKGFNVQASLSTMFVSNRINLGPFWNYSHGHYHVGLGYQVAFDYGRLKEFGYHTTVVGWEQQPSVAAGYSFKTMALSIRGDIYYTSSMQVTEGHNTIPYNSGFLNGYSITTSLEQRLWKNRVMSFGFKYNYLRYHFLAWPAFPVNKYHYVVPEFQLGLNF